MCIVTLFHLNLYNICLVYIWTSADLSTCCHSFQGDQPSKWGSWHLNQGDVHIQKDRFTIFQGDLELSLTSKFLNEVEGDSGTIEIELGGFVPLQDKVSLHWNLFCHPRLTNQLQSSDGDQNGDPNGDLMGTLGFQLLGFQRDLLLKKTRISLWLQGVERGIGSNNWSRWEDLNLWLYLVD